MFATVCVDLDLFPPYQWGSSVTLHLLEARGGRCFNDNLTPPVAAEADAQIKWNQVLNAGESSWYIIDDPPALNDPNIHTRMHACMHRSMWNHTHRRALFEVSANPIECLTVQNFKKGVGSCINVVITILLQYYPHNNENKSHEPLLEAPQIPSFITAADRNSSWWNEFGWKQATKPRCSSVSYKRGETSRSFK